MNSSSVRNPFARFADRLAAGHRPTQLLVYLVMLGVYLLTATSNFSETDDVFAFAYRAEHLPLDDISDPRLMLYHMLMRGLYLAASTIDPTVTALSLMRGVALLSAPWILLMLVRLLTSGLALRSESAVITAAFLAFSYGYWRYAVEADVYIPAILLVLLTLRLLFTAGIGPIDPRLIGAAMLAGLTILFYQPAVLAVLFAFPLLFLCRERLAQLPVYLGIAGMLLVAAYVAAYHFSQSAPLTLDSLLAFLSQRSHEFIVPPLSVAVFFKSIIKSGFALSHDLVSANWMFGVDTLSQGIQRIFPANVIEEEVFAARSAGWVPFLSLLWLPALAAVLFMLAQRFPGGAWPGMRGREVQLFVLWLAIGSAVIGRLNPAGIEAWLMMLVPLFVVLAVFVIDPLVGANRTRLLVTALSLYLAHNLTGGIAMMWQADGDYDSVKARWVIEQATEHDLVIVVDDAGLAELLRYRSRAQVDLVRAMSTPSIAASLYHGQPPDRLLLTYGRDFGGQDVYRHIRLSTSRGGSVFVFDEFFTWDTEYRGHYAPQTAWQREILTRLRQIAVRDRHTSAAGTSYRISLSGHFVDGAVR